MLARNEINNSMTGECRGSMPPGLATLHPVFRPSLGDDMKYIKLTQGKRAMVDDEDFERINQFKWHTAKQRTSNLYARREYASDGKRMHQYMHCFIMPLFIGMEVDHIDGDGLNNQKNNLRACTRKENSHNMKVHSNNMTGYKGVCKYKKWNLWSAMIHSNGKNYYLGCFKNPLDAARAYNDAAIKHHGKFAWLNNIEAKS
jgi:hypothetical protein